MERQANISLLAQSADSVLLVVDIQVRLAAAMPREVREQVLHNAGILIRAAQLLEVPILSSEQYPKGLGETEPVLASLLPSDVQAFAKTSFSCCAVDSLAQAIADTGRRQVIIAGLEAHICVLQTALGLSAQGYHPFVVADAVCSRRPEHTENALHRLRQAGAVVTNSESVLFEWVGDSTHPQFKTIAALVR